MTLSDHMLKHRLLATRVTALAIVVGYWWLGRPDVTRLVIGTLIMAMGQAVRVWAAGSLIKNDALTTWGPYARVRHPLYWGSALSALGLCAASGLWWSYALVTLVFTVIYIPTLAAEERALERTYGEAYRRYCAAVPRLGLRRGPYAENPGAVSFTWSRMLDNGEHRTLIGTALLVLLLWLKLALAGGLR